jgi:hypothetical protein
VSDAERFSSIFDGLAQAYGTYRVERKAASGKNTGRAAVIREPRTVELWENHLQGKGDGLAIIPINEDNECLWGCIDVDQYPLDHKQLVQKIRRLKLPLVVCRSKSGGAHVYLFVTEWVSAKGMREVLQHLASLLGIGNNCEIFPKQVELNLERGDVGNMLNTPYFDAENGLRYAFLDDGSSATLAEFFELHAKHVQTPEQLDSLVVEPPAGSDMPLPEGPPCLQILAANKISEGGRNNGLFNLGVYLRKAYPDTWESEILTYNLTFLDPPLPLNEVNIVVKQLGKKDYGYRCKDAPISSYCNADVCRTRRYGVGAAASGMDIANLRKYDSVPPIWFVDVNGRPLEIDTEALMNQIAFQKACVEQLNFMPRSTSKQSWETRINSLLQTMSETEGAIIEVSADASNTGQLYDYLEEWCTSMQKAATKEEILLRRPFTDEDGRTYFRLKDFEAYLKKHRFTEFRSYKLAQRLRDRNGESVVLRLRDRSVRVWSIPSFDVLHEPIEAPSFQRSSEPF